MDPIKVATKRRDPWNKDKLVGQKSPLRLKEIWAIRIRLQLAARIRDLVLFNLAIDSKLRACDLVKLRVRDIAHGDRVSTQTTVMQQKTQRPVQFEITEPTRDALLAWINQGVGAAFRRLVTCGPNGRRTPLDTAILEDRSSLDRGARRQRFRIWNALHQKNEGIAHL